MIRPPREAALVYRRRPAFTIIELLVVIGIITVLMAILVPVISRARIAGQTAATTSQIQRITAGINNYYHDFNGYPGALPNSAFAKRETSKYVQGNSAYTQSEDLVMALLGGLSPTGNMYPSPAAKYDPAFVNSGPVSFNLNNPSKKSAYVQANAGELPKDLNAPLSAQGADYAHLAYCTDSPLPEFLDLYAEPRPLIYLRATPGASQIIYQSTGTYNPACNYDYSQILPYLKTPYTGDVKDDWFAKGLTETSAMLTVSSGTTNAARGAGSYIIISAGPDRSFGTADDIMFSAGGGK